LNPGPPKFEAELLTTTFGVAYCAVVELQDVNKGHPSAVVRKDNGKRPDLNRFQLIADETEHMKCQLERLPVCGNVRAKNDPVN
jgi:hypothetical protein